MRKISWAIIVIFSLLLGVLALASLQLRYYQRSGEEFFAYFQHGGMLYPALRSELKKTQKHPDTEGVFKNAIREIIALHQQALRGYEKRIYNQPRLLPGLLTGSRDEYQKLSSQVIGLSSYLSNETEKAKSDLLDIFKDENNSTLSEEEYKKAYKLIHYFSDADFIAKETELYLKQSKLQHIVERESRYYYNIVLITSLSIGLYAMFILYKLRQSSILLQSVNEQLEGQVNIRTKELLAAKETAEETKEELSEYTKVLEQKNLELKESRQKAEATTRLKSEFLATMSHEIRTPMNGILGMANILMETRLDNKQREYIRMLQMSGNSLLELINDILDFSKIESGKLELDYSSLNLSCIIGDVVELLSLKAKEKNLELIFDYKPGTPSLLVGDETRIRQIFYNLIGNAIKFTDEGYIEIAVAVTEITQKKVYMQAHVRDTGIGIDKEKQEHVFDTFSQEDSSTTRKYGGSGLGLAICRSLATMMGGDVWLESSKGNGSTFFVSMELEIDTEHVEKPPSYDKLKNLRVLVVDDLEVAGRMVAEQLEWLNVKAVYLKSAKDALKAMDEAIQKNRAFDMLLVDYRMPEMDGITMYQKIKDDKQFDNIPAIIMSNSLKSEHIKIFSEAGLDAFLAKPFRPNELIELVAKVWDGYMNNQRCTITYDSTMHLVEDVNDDDAPEEETFTKLYDVLLVEDNEVNQQVAIRMLSKQGCEVVLAENGKISLDKVKSKSFDLVLMDCQMPEMDGFQATKEIKSMQRKGEVKETPVIALTANAMKGDREKCMAAGMDDYMTKPLKQEELKEMIIKWAGDRGEPEVRTTTKQAGKRANDNTENGESFIVMELYNDFCNMMGGTARMTLQSFIRSSHKQMTSMDEAIKGQDMQTVLLSSHSLKSSAMQVGARQLSKAAAIIEQKAKEEVGFDEINTLFNDLQNLHRNSVEELDSLIDKLAA